MKRKIFTIGVLLLAISGIGWFVFDQTRDHNRIYFEKESGIKLPRGLTNIAHSTEFEFALTSHYTIPLTKIEVFVLRNKLTSSPPPSWKPIFSPEYLTSPWDEVPSSGKLLYATGASQVSAWDMLLDRESGEMWTSIYYADYSGDLPGRVLR